jgi:RQC domain
MVIEQLIREAYIKSSGDFKRPVLDLTEKGKQAAKEIDLAILDLEVKDKPEKPQKTSKGKPSEMVDLEGIRKSVLGLVSGLKSPVGKTRATNVLRGSKAKWIAPLGADKLAEYDSVDARQDEVIKVIDGLIKEKLLRKGGSRKFPVLEITDKGKGELGVETSPDEDNIISSQESLVEENDFIDEEVIYEKPLDEYDIVSDNSDLSWGEYAQMMKNEEPLSDDIDILSGSSIDKSVNSSSLDETINRFFNTAPDDENEVIQELSIYHPQQIMMAIEHNLDSTTIKRVRAISLVGRMCGRHGLEFILHESKSENVNIRLLAASVLFEISRDLRTQADYIQEGLEASDSALRELAEDEAEHIRQRVSGFISSLSIDPDDK